MRQIKRYPNRKLYDTVEKRYVTLNAIARLIRQGHDVHVTDHATGEDLTAITLTQIIFEQEKQQAGFLPRSVLTGLVQAGGERLSTLRRALVLPLGLRAHVDDEIERRLRALVAQGELDEAVAALVREKLLNGGAADGDAALNVGSGELERLLEQAGVPTRTDIEGVEAQLARLDEKITSLMERRR